MTLPVQNVKTPSYGTAISKLRPDCVWIIYENDLSTLEWSSENTLPRPTDAEITAELDSQMTAFNAKQYQRDRQPEYPDLKSQLDMLYHDIKDGKLDSGTWIAAVEAVKAKHPKP